MNTILHYYTPEILKIAKENDADYDVACQMFINNIDDVGMEGDLAFYHGADELDYSSLKNLIPAMKTKERADMITTWDKDFDKNTLEISEMNKKGDVEGIRKFMLSLAKEHE